MKKISKALCFIILFCFACVSLFACGQGENESWISPMIGVDLSTNTLDTNTSFELSLLNMEAVLPADFARSSAVAKASLSLAYKGEGDYKCRINARIDEVEVEEDGSLGHSVAEFGVSKSHVAILFYADEAWYDGAYGSNAASGGDTLFDNRYHSEQDAEYSATRRAIAFNKETAQRYSQIDFYVVGLIDGYYVLNFYLEAADTHGHFHGINKLALTSVLITVGTPVFSANGGGAHES